MAALAQRFATTSLTGGEAAGEAPPAGEESPVVYPTCAVISWSSTLPLCVEKVPLQACAGIQEVSPTWALLVCSNGLASCN